MNTDAQKLIEQAEKNVAKWGDQSFDTLALAMSEESGELSQAVLQHMHESGSMDRIRQEAIDCGALALQVLRHFRNRDTTPVLYVAPQQADILTAMDYRDGKGPAKFSRARDFDDVHRQIADEVAHRGGKIEVRIDTGFRTGESRMQSERYGWIEDRSFDVREMMSACGIPIRLAPDSDDQARGDLNDCRQRLGHIRRSIDFLCIS